MLSVILERRMEKMRNKRILLMGLILGLIASFIVPSVSALVWNGKDWSQELTGVYEDPAQFPGEMITYAADPEQAGYTAGKVGIQTNIELSGPWMKFSFITPWVDHLSASAASDTSEVEFYFSSSDLSQWLKITCTKDEFSYSAQDRDGDDYSQSIPAGTLWKTDDSEPNMLRLAIRTQATGGYIDVYFNTIKLFTIQDATFAYDSPSVLKGNAYLTTRSTSVDRVFWTDFDEIEVGDPPYTYQVHPPIITSTDAPSVDETETFTLECTFTDEDSWETFDAKIDWGDGSAIETVPITDPGTYTFDHDYPNDSDLDNDPGTTPNYYDGTITIEDEEGGSDSDGFQAVITETDPIISNFNYVSSLDGSGYEVTITVDVDMGPDGPGTFSWKEGASELSTTEDPVITFPDLNSHILTLTITDEDERTDTITETVSIGSPIVNFDSHSSEAYIQDSLTFTGTYDYPGEDMTSVTFDYDDGTAPGSFDNVANTFSGTHTYTNPGAYTIEVTVVTDDSKSATDTTTITILPKPPSVSFKSATTTIDEGDSQTFNLDLVDLTVYSGSPTYTWTITGPDAYTHVGSSFAETFLKDGTYTVTLTVTENGQTDSDTMTLVVENEAPQITLGADLYEINIGTLVDFTSTVFDSGEDIQSITFQFEGDSNVYDSTRIDIFDTPSYHEKGYYKYTFNELGDFTVTSTATDDNGAVSDSIIVTVKAIPLALEAITATPTIFGERDPVTFSSVITGTDLGLTYDAEWYLDDVKVYTQFGISVGTPLTYPTSFPQDRSFKLELKITTTALTQTYNGYIDNLPPRVTIDSVNTLAVPGEATLFGHIDDADDFDFTYEWYVDSILVSSGTQTIDDGYDLSITGTFPTEGNHEVELRVTDNDITDDYTGTGVRDVYVNKAPYIISLDYSPKPVTQGDTVHFTIEANDFDEDSEDLNYIWNFGGGVIKLEQNPTHKYETFGMVSVEVSVIDSYGVSDTEVLFFNVLPLPISLDPIVCDMEIINEGDSPTFTSSILGTDNGQTYTAEWFLDGVFISPALEVGIGVPIELTHVIPQDGTHTVLLQVTGNGVIETISYEFDALNVPPVVVLDPVDFQIYPEEVIFTGTITDVEDHPFTYNLFIDTVEVMSGSIPSGFDISIPYTFTTGGTYDVELFVYDLQSGEGSDAIIVEINNPPIITSVTYDPDEIHEGDAVSFAVDAYDPDDETLTYLWNFGDGETSTLQNPTHNYDVFGTITVTITVTDESTASITEEITIQIIPDLVYPRPLKEDAIDLLEEAIDIYGDYGKSKGHSKKDKSKCYPHGDIEYALNKIIGYIEKSLSEKYWEDDLHLEVGKGYKVFIYERAAVSKSLRYIRQWENESDLEGLVDTLYDVIDLLVEADRAIAFISLEEARNAIIPEHHHHWNYLRQAEYHYAKGLEYTAAGRPKHAITSFKTSWQHSQKVLGNNPHPFWDDHGWHGWDGWDDWDEWGNWDWDEWYGWDDWDSWEDWDWSNGNNDNNGNNGNNGNGNNGNNGNGNN